MEFQTLAPKTVETVNLTFFARNNEVRQEKGKIA